VVHARQSHAAEVVQQLVDFVEFVGVVGLFRLFNELGGLEYRPFVERVELFGRDGVPGAVEVVEIPELVHYGVAHAAVCVGYVREYVFGNRNVVLVVHRAYPEAHDVRAPFADVHVGRLRLAVAGL